MVPLPSGEVFIREPPLSAHIPLCSFEIFIFCQCIWNIDMKTNLFHSPLTPSPPTHLPLTLLSTQFFLDFLPSPLALLHTHKHNPLLAIPGKWVAECVWPKMFSTWFSNTYLCHQIALRQRSPLKAGYSEDKLLFSPPWNGSISSFNNRLEILPFLALNNVFHLRYEKNCGIRKKEMWIQVSSYLYFHFHYCSGTLGN